MDFIEGLGKRKYKMELDIIKKLDDLQRLSQKNLMAHTDFMDTDSAERVRMRLRKQRITFAESGGYAGAENIVFFLFRDEMQKEAFDPEQYISVVRVVPADGKRYSHRDYLGSVMSLGISRNKLGDIVIGGDQTFIIAFSSIAQYIAYNLSSISRTGARCELASSAEVPTVLKEFTDTRFTVASLRCDCVAAAVFGLSREKADRAIASGLLTVNRQEEIKPHRQLKENDMIGLRGSGRAKIAGLGGTTKKGRTVIVVRREN